MNVYTLDLDVKDVFHQQQNALGLLPDRCGTCSNITFLHSCARPLLTCVVCLLRKRCCMASLPPFGRCHVAVACSKRAFRDGPDGLALAVVPRRQIARACARGLQTSGMKNEAGACFSVYPQMSNKGAGHGFADHAMGLNLSCSGREGATPSATCASAWSKMKFLQSRRGWAQSTRAALLHCFATRVA